MRMRLLRFLVPLTTTLSAAAQAQTVFGDSWCGPAFCATAVYNTTTSSITYTVLAASNGGAGAGWYGMGTGTLMSNAAMVVAWATSDGSFVLSQRSATHHVEPRPVANLASTNVATLLTDASATNSSATTISWNIPQSSSPGSKWKMIWGKGPSQDLSSDTSSTIQQHGPQGYGTFSFDLTKPLGSSFVVPNPAAASTSRPQADYNTIIAAHLAVMVIAWLVVAPLGIYIARFGRGTNFWFKSHRALQGVVVLLLTAVGLVMAIWAVQTTGRSHFKSQHGTTGLVAVILLVFQVILGVVNHKLFDKNRTRRPLRNWLHIALGAALFGLTASQVKTGLTLWELTGKEVENWAFDLLYAWLAVLVLVYFLGVFFLLPRQLEQERANRTKSEYDIYMETYGGTLPSRRPYGAFAYPYGV